MDSGLQNKLHVTYMKTAALSLMVPRQRALACTLSFWGGNATAEDQKSNTTNIRHTANIRQDYIMFQAAQVTGNSTHKEVFALLNRKHRFLNRLTVKQNGYGSVCNIWVAVRI
jgi:hypothetical protein